MYTVCFSDGADAYSAERLSKSNDVYSKMEEHKKYVSNVRFMDETELISASGDFTCKLWDIERKIVKTTYNGHQDSVMALDINEKNKNLFASASIDWTIKIWDMRASDKHTMSFEPREYGGFHTVKWFIDGQCFVAGNEDGRTYLFDMRSYGEINDYKDSQNLSLHSQDLSGVTCVDVSKSGKYIFTAYDNGQMYMFSTLKGGNFICEMPQDARIPTNGLEVSPCGYALATGGWDWNLRTFA